MRKTIEYSFQFLAGKASPIVLFMAVLADYFNDQDLGLFLVGVALGMAIRFDVKENSHD